MKLQRLLIALTLLNLSMLSYSLMRPLAAGAQNVPVLRGRALEITDDQGRVRASISVLPADPNVKMPDGSTGYPESVLLRLINSKGRPNVKITATEIGSGLGLGGEVDPTYVQILATGANTTLKMTNKSGSTQLIKP